VARAASSPVHALDGWGDLGDAWGLLAACDLFVSNDSGLMNLAAASGLPTVAVFGPSEAHRTRPFGPRGRAVITDRPCAPCYGLGRFAGCPHEYDPCLAEIAGRVRLVRVQRFGLDESGRGFGAADRDGISGARGYEFARRWVAQGHRVTVLATASRYSSLSRPPQTRFVRRLQVDGIDVVAVRIPYGQQMGAWARLRAFFSFMIWASLLGVFAARHDVVFASSTPLTVGVPGVMISRLRGTPFVFEVRDLWPRAPIELGVLQNPVAIFVARLAERIFYRLAAHVIALSPGMVDGVASAGVAREKISLIPNACDLDLFAAAPTAGVRAKLGLPDDAIVFIHAGALGPSNDGAWLLDLAAQWRKQGRDHLRLLLLGEGSERGALEQRIARDGLTNVVLAGPVTRREAAAIIKACDGGLVSFADLPVLATNSPNKFFDYLAAGLPTMVNTAGWTGELVTEAQAGLVLPRDAARAAEMLAELADDPARRKAMGAAARRLAERFDREKLAGQALDVLRQSAAQRTCGVEALLKRATDFLLAAFVLLIGSPLLALIALAIKRDSPGPVFFRQERIGRDGRSFRMWKFRTMVVGAADLGDGCATGRSTKRRKCSTCCGATCRWSARGRRCRSTSANTATNNANVCA
jgi:glycosyltransferase involved in cell wall biosynthesis